MVCTATVNLSIWFHLISMKCFITFRILTATHIIIPPQTADLFIFYTKYQVHYQ